MSLQKAVSATTAGLLKIRHMLRRMPDVKQWWITGFNPRYKNPVPHIMTTIGSINFSGHEELFESLKQSAVEKHCFLTKKGARSGYAGGKKQKI